MAEIELKPCWACGAECSVQKFAGPHIEGVVKLWMCSRHKQLGGDCANTNAYLSEEAWNIRSHPRLPDIEGLVEKLREQSGLTLAGGINTRLLTQAADAIESLAASREEMASLLSDVRGCFWAGRSGLRGSTGLLDSTWNKVANLDDLRRARKAYLGEDEK